VSSYNVICSKTCMAIEYCVLCSSTVVGEVFEPNTVETEVSKFGGFGVEGVEHRRCHICNSTWRRIIV
jgi:hypothetical protein